MDAILAPIRTEITQIRADIRRDLAQVRITLAQVCHTASDWYWCFVSYDELSKTRNHQLFDGKSVPFVVVPFNDGSMPPVSPSPSHLNLEYWLAHTVTLSQAHLPLIRSVATIRSLNAMETTAYAAGYELGNIATVAERRKAIGRAIGCSVAV